MNDEAGSSSGSDESRREKLRKIIELGIDPWGQRFDDRDMIGDIRNRTGEIKFVNEAGDSIDLPTEEQLGDSDFRSWCKEQGKGTMTGPKAAPLVEFCCTVTRASFNSSTSKTGLAGFNCSSAKSKLVKRTGN